MHLRTYFADFVFRLSPGSCESIPLQHLSMTMVEPFCVDDSSTIRRLFRLCAWSLQGRLVCPRRPFRDSGSRAHFYTCTNRMQEHVDVCIHVYARMHACVHEHVHTHRRNRTRIHVRKLDIHTYTDLFEYVYTCTNMHLCICVSVCRTLPPPHPLLHLHLSQEHHTIHTPTSVSTFTATFTAISTSTNTFGHTSARPRRPQVFRSIATRATSVQVR